MHILIVTTHKWLCCCGGHTTGRSLPGAAPSASRLGFNLSLGFLRWHFDPSLRFFLPGSCEPFQDAKGDDLCRAPARHEPPVHVRKLLLPGDYGAKNDL